MAYIIHWLLTPFRRAQRKKYSESGSEELPRWELPNDSFLPIISRYVAAGETATFVVKGYSMRPFLEHLRDKVELSPWTQLQVGDAVLAEIKPGTFVLHRIMSMDGENLILKGDGNIRGVEYCTKKDVRGLVTKYIRPGGHVLLASDARLQQKIQRWNSLPTFLRRMFLFIYKQTI